MLGSLVPATCMVAGDSLPHELSLQRRGNSKAGVVNKNQEEETFSKEARKVD